MRTQRLEPLLLGLTRHRDDSGATDQGQLDEGGPHSPCGPRDEDRLPRREISTHQHLLSSVVGAWEGRQLCVGHGTGDRVRVDRRNRHELGEPTVTFTAEVFSDLRPQRELWVADRGVDEHALSDAGTVHALADRRDHTCNRGALDPREHDAVLVPRTAGAVVTSVETELLADT